MNINLGQIKAQTPREPLIDGFARQISYLRVSVTDRCDFRCTYCMAEHMSFLPRKDLLSLEELDRLCTAFVERGVRKLRLTGGEPLVRKNLMYLIERLSRHLGSGLLDELTLTTNGSQLAKFAQQLAGNGVKRLNISLDTLDPEKFAKITRWGSLNKVLEGIDAAQKAGLKVKINTVALKNVNADEIENLMKWAHGRDMELTLIETMPLGEIDEDRTDQYISLSDVRNVLEKSYTLQDLSLSTGGPARYVKIAETGGRMGFITPMSHNFCATCNRVRVTCTGQLFACLGYDDGIDLRAALRASEDNELLHQTIDRAIATKPERHNFVIENDAKPSVQRHMSVTGG